MSTRNSPTNKILFLSHLNVFISFYPSVSKCTSQIQSVKVGHWKGWKDWYRVYCTNKSTILKPIIEMKSRWSFRLHSSSSIWRWITCVRKFSATITLPGLVFNATNIFIASWVVAKNHFVRKLNLLCCRQTVKLA